MKYILLDTEDTDLTRMLHVDLDKPMSLRRNGAAVIQLGAIVMDSSLQIEGCFCLYNDCIRAACAPKAFEVNKLDMRELRKSVAGVTLEQNLMTYIPSIFSDDVCIIGYNTQFDFDMISQTIRNFVHLKPFKSLLGYNKPKSGRWIYDVAEFYAGVSKGRKFYRRLSDVSKTYQKEIDATFESLRPRVLTNVPQHFAASGMEKHSAFYDAVATFVLWRSKCLWN